MLVVSRKIGERVDFYHPALGRFPVEVRRVAGNRVTLAIDAPREVLVLRGELNDAADEIHGAGTETPEGRDAPPAPPLRMFHCSAVGYPGPAKVVEAADPREAAEFFGRSGSVFPLLPVNLQVTPIELHEPTETYRVSVDRGDIFATLVGIASKLEATA